MNPLPALAVVVALTAAPVARAIEEPRYAVEQQLDAVEVRAYAPYVVAEVVVPGPAEDAGNQGFRILAAYIFGKNKGERKIAMTAPVTQTATPVKIEMTAPVVQTAADGGFAVRFMMPSGFTLDTLPEPIDPAIRLNTEAGGRFAVIRYSGFWSQANYDRHLQALREAIEAAGLHSTGAPIWARFDPPWTPWFMRRNEIWLRLS